MITLYTWGTPNGRKVSIMLEECALPYSVRKIDITAGDQLTPEYLALNPNGKIPVLVDEEGPAGKAAAQPFVLSESGAILIYLAGKTGRFLPADERGKFMALQWLMFQMGGIGPVFGQAHHFLRFAPQPVPYAIERYTKETARLYGVLNTHLAQHEYLADEYSIADMAAFPWVARHEWHRIDLADHPAVRRWYAAVGARPAVRHGMEIPR